MIKGRRRLEAETEDVDNSLAVNRERQREIQAHYAGTNKPISGRDQRELDNLDDEERYCATNAIALYQCNTHVARTISMCIIIGS